MKSIYIAILFIFFSIYGFCQDQYSALIGDWINSEQRFIISFTDSLFSFGDFAEFQPYTISENEIFIKEFDKIKRNGFDKPLTRIKSTVIKRLGAFELSNSKLTMIFDSNYFYGDTVIFSRLKKVSDLKFDSLYFKSETSYKGPWYDMIINHERILYRGFYRTDMIGSYNGTFNDEYVELINKKIQQIDFAKVKSEYIANHSDGQTRHIIIFRNGIEYNYEIYGHEEEPLEFNVLFHYLRELANWIELKKINRNIELTRLNDFFYPRPPLPEELNKNE